MFQWIVEYMLRNVKVKKEQVMEAVELADKDFDGFISLGELVVLIKRRLKK